MLQVYPLTVLPGSPLWRSCDTEKRLFYHKVDNEQGGTRDIHPSVTSGTGGVLKAGGTLRYIILILRHDTVRYWPFVFFVALWSSGILGCPKSHRFTSPPPPQYLPTSHRGFSSTYRGVPPLLSCTTTVAIQYTAMHHRSLRVHRTPHVRIVCHRVAQRPKEETCKPSSLIDS